jgi:hypothetical protein
MLAELSGCAGEPDLIVAPCALKTSLQDRDLKRSPPGVDQRLKCIDTVLLNELAVFDLYGSIRLAELVRKRLLSCAPLPNKQEGPDFAVHGGRSAGREVTEPGKRGRQKRHKRRNRPGRQGAGHPVIPGGCSAGHGWSR